MPNDNLKSYLHLHFIVFVWGFTAILGKLISLDALPLVWFRMLLAVGFILIYIGFNKTSLQVPKKTLIGFLLAGLIIALHWFTFFKAIKVSNISVTLACLSTGAFFASLLEPIFYGRKIIWYEVLFGIIVFLGLYIIFNIDGQFINGIILALSSAFLSALFSMINGKYAKEYDPSIISFYELLGGVLFFSFFLFYSGTVMLTINLEPIYGIILAVIVFEETEKMSVNFYIGALIILSTVILNGVIKYFYKTSK